MSDLPTTKKACGCPTTLHCCYDFAPRPTIDLETAAEALARIYYERSPANHLESVTWHLWLEMATEDIQKLLPHIDPTPEVR